MMIIHLSLIEIFNALPNILNAKNVFCHLDHPSGVIRDTVRRYMPETKINGLALCSPNYSVERTDYSQTLIISKHAPADSAIRKLLISLPRQYDMLISPLISLDGKITYEDVLSVFLVATDKLEYGGTLVMRAPTYYPQLIRQMAMLFSKIIVIKPAVSNQLTLEHWIVAMDFGTVMIKRNIDTVSSIARALVGAREAHVTTHANITRRITEYKIFIDKWIHINVQNGIAPITMLAYKHNAQYIMEYKQEPPIYQYDQLVRTIWQDEQMNYSPCTMRLFSPVTVWTNEALGAFTGGLEFLLDVGPEKIEKLLYIGAGFQIISAVYMLMEMFPHLLVDIYDVQYESVSCVDSVNQSRLTITGNEFTLDDAVRYHGEDANLNRALAVIMNLSDMECQQVLINYIEPEWAMLRFDPTRIFVPEYNYLKGTMKYPLFTEARSYIGQLMILAEDKGKTKTWKLREYREEIHYHQTISRCCTYTLPVITHEKLDNCYDCVALVTLLQKYIMKYDIYTLDEWIEYILSSLAP
jgi:hypothetical protein